MLTCVQLFMLFMLAVSTCVSPYKVFPSHPPSGLQVPFCLAVPTRAGLPPRLIRLKDDVLLITFLPCPDSKLKINSTSNYVKDNFTCTIPLIESTHQNHPLCPKRDNHLEHLQLEILPHLQPAMK